MKLQLQGYWDWVETRAMDDDDKARLAETILSITYIRIVLDSTGNMFSFKFLNNNLV